MTHTLGHLEIIVIFGLDFIPFGFSKHHMPIVQVFLLFRSIYLIHNILLIFKCHLVLKVEIRISANDVRLRFPSSIFRE